MACNFGRTGDRFINFYPLGLCHMQQRRGTGVWFIHCLRIDFCRCDVAHERDRLDCMGNRAGNHGEPVHC